MKKQLLGVLFSVFFVLHTQAQTTTLWSPHNGEKSKITTDKAVARASFPKEFKLYDLNIEPLRNILFSAIGSQTAKKSAVITLPSAEGKIELFEVFEASNFEPALQAQFPEIRAFSGKGITDKYATLKLSVSPQGIQTMVFRTDRENEFIEAYSQDHTVYAVFKSQRDKSSSNWTCSTVDEPIVKGLNKAVQNTQKSSSGELKVMRLAQSVTAEYSAYYGWTTTTGNISLVVTAVNNTMTRCNGVYEKDLGLHLNLIANTTVVFFNNPATDGYTNGADTSYNSQLQTNLTNLIGEANYDIGHLFSAVGGPTGNGNAGCIGCVCVNGSKGRGFTTRSVPQGDDYDIDFVVHEVGHQLGGNHTFSQSSEGSGVNKEVGSGITIMGYAGITNNDVAAHSIDIFHQSSIAQIQTNLGTKTCPVTTSITANNATPVVNPVSNYTIPFSTPFVLTGSATDANAGDALTYCWEQNDDAGSSTGAASSASATKTIGPNFISWSPTASSSRYFPRLSSIIANSATTGFATTPCATCDAGMLSEALSSVARTLNFRLTVRDNAPYSSTAPITVGQTDFTDMTVTVNATAGPFLVSSPNTAISWTTSTNQNVTWDVAGTTSNGVNAPFVDIFLSTDGGLTYPIQLANKVPNDGSEVVTVPNNPGSTNRVMVKGNNHIFFDISNTDFTIAAPASAFAVAATGEQTTLACTLTSTTFTFNYTALAGFTGTTTFSAAGNPAGSTVSFSPTSMTADGLVTMTIGNLTGLGGNSSILVTATSGATSKTVPFYLYLGLANVALTTPANNAVSQNTSLTLNWTPNPAATSYDVQVASDIAFATIVSSGNVATNSYNLSGLAQGTNYFWRVLPKNATCTGTYGSGFRFTTGSFTCNTTVSTNVPIAISASGTPTVTSTLNIPSGGTISDVNVNLNIQHTWINDLTATLTSPAGTTVQLFSRQCNPGASVNDIDATFDDAGIAIACGDFPGISGTVLPAQVLSAFNGQTSTGTWTLTVSDAFNADGGSINAWSLNICSVTLGVAENEFTNFNLFPNPNNGDFTVKLTSGSSENIKVNVYDMRGRQVYENSFANTGAFNQNINLDKIQAGVYLVAITDGTKKTVKQIVVE